jgi:DNA-binding LacI/PurR family transcriptional regulator
VVKRIASLNDLGIAEKLLPPVTTLHIAPDELWRKFAKLLTEQFGQVKRHDAGLCEAESGIGYFCYGSVAF